jgi:high-affinity Fe2+/Pb2+ permease
MEFIFEAIFELILEGGKEVATDKKLSNWIRYPLILLALLIWGGLIAVMVFVGFLDLRDELWRAIAMWILALALIIGSIWYFRSEYKSYKKKKGL